MIPGSLAELSVPSGITSLILATTPLWMVVMERVVEAKQAPSPLVIAGAVVAAAVVGAREGAHKKITPRFARGYSPGAT